MTRPTGRHGQRIFGTQTTPIHLALERPQLCVGTLPSPTRSGQRVLREPHNCHASCICWPILVPLAQDLLVSPCDARSLEARHVLPGLPLNRRRIHSYEYPKARTRCKALSTKIFGRPASVVDEQRLLQMNNVRSMSVDLGGAFRSGQDCIFKH